MIEKNNKEELEKYVDKNIEHYEAIVIYMS